MGLSTHVLDIAEGQPARGLPVTCDRLDDEATARIATGETNADGRIPALVADEDLQPGRYRLRFDVAAHVRERGRSTVFPVVEVTVEIAAADEHYHIPLLLAGNGYTVYRGS